MAINQTITNDNNIDINDINEDGTLDEATKDSKEDLVECYVVDDEKEPRIVEVWLNGVRHLLPKGDTHMVPPGVKEILEHSKRMKKEKRDRIAAAKAKAKGL